MDWDYQATTSVLQSRFIDLDQREEIEEKYVSM